MGGADVPSLEEWAALYEKKTGSVFRYDPAAERLEFDPDHGFMTWGIDQYHRAFVVGKVVGNGKHWRALIYKMALAGRGIWIKGVLCCTKRNPQAYMRILGGKLKKMEHTYDFTTGKSTTLWFIYITLGDTKERGDTDGSFACADSAAGLADDLARQGGIESAG